MPVGLPVSRKINVTVSLTPLATAYQNFDSLMVFGSSNVIDTEQRYRSYSGLTEVAGDFLSTDPEYLAAELFFSQTPQPTEIMIARWAAAATSGSLVGGILSGPDQEMSNFTSITSGGFKIAINGGEVTAVDDLNFSAAGNLNAVATAITAGLTAASLDATCVWNATQGYFEIVSTTTGTSSTVSDATSPATGTDVSALLQLTAATAQYAVAGIAAEAALTALSTLDAMAVQFYGVSFASTSLEDSDRLAIAAYVEASGTTEGIPHIFGTTTQNTAALSADESTDVGSELMAAGYQRTFCQYSSSTPYADASLFGLLLTVNFDENNSLITLDFKGEPGITAEVLNTDEANALDAKRYNYFAEFNNESMIVVNGWMSGPAYVDEIFGADGLANTLQTDLFNLFSTVTTKIPQTDSGAHLEVVTAQGSCAKFVDNGYLAPGVWESEGFGTLNEGDTLTLGYYVYIEPMALQSAADRDTRASPPLQIAAKLAGAIQSVDVSVLVNR